MATATQETVENLCASVGIDAEYKGREKNADNWEHDAWTVTLTYQGRTYPATSYRMGTGHSKPYPTAKVHAELESWQLKAKQHRWKPTPPTAASVVDSLLLDVSGLDEPFEGWAASLGYDTDSRKAEAIYRACLETLPKLRAFFGADFERFEQAERL